ncbi:universal stress protein [Clostridium arbusti]|uniref:universal stress protein n=1 Tax=Clostridium arbusti TaxID=1137848 RepID=UPI0002894888|nr:universal stress protein [Clostridium arbusti]
MSTNKKKILIPLDGTDRSMHSLDYVKELFKKEDVTITIMHVLEIVIINDMMLSDTVVTNSQKESDLLMERAKAQLQGYNVETYNPFGYAGDEIVRKARQDKFDIIVMTKSSKKGLAKMIGSVTRKVLQNTSTLLIIVPE